MNQSQSKTKVFLDGADPLETREAIVLLGSLDGQTTNPTLVAKSPAVRARVEQGKKLTRKEILGIYKEVAKEISSLIPRGSVSIEVYADRSTTAPDILRQAEEMSAWIPNAHIKIPITREGLVAAGMAVQEGLRVNLTLCFSEKQAAAVHAATLGAKKGDVFISPFIGRLDDRGENGMDLVKNILAVYERGGSHAEVLAASVRNLDHFLRAVQLGSDIITAPLKILKEWSACGREIPPNFSYSVIGLNKIPCQETSLTQNWQDIHDISHELTDQGLEKFSNDWNALICEN